MQQNIQYGMGYYAPPPSHFDPTPPLAPPMAPDYGPIFYGPPASSSPGQASHLSYPSVPSSDAVYTAAAQNSSDPSYYAANHPYAPQVPSIPFGDPSFSSPNGSYIPSTSFYSAPQSQSSIDSSYVASYGRSFDYGASLPQPISTSSTLSQPYGSNPSWQRNGSFQDGYQQAAAVNSSPINDLVDRGGSGSFMSSKPSEYDANNQTYLQGRINDRPGLDHLGPAIYDNGPQDSLKYSDVYPYDGGHTEPYGAHGTKSSVEISSIYNPLSASVNSTKIARATPKSDAEVVGNGVQKYRVNLLPESSSSDPPTDVLCQIGLDGVRMLVPSTNKLLRIYPLETITKWKTESSTFTFWAKTIVDVEERRIRLQSNSYTVSAILDTLTAACIQLCEMMDKETPSDSTSTSSSSDPASQKKSSFVDWVTLKPKSSGQEEKQHWVPDEAVKKCTSCGAEFGAFVRRHHCRNCGDIFCDKCTRGRTPLNSDQDLQPVRVCDRCLAEVTQRLTNMDLNSKPAVQRRHEDLAKKLQEEMEKNAARKFAGHSNGSLGSFGSSSSGSAGIQGPSRLWSTQPTSEGSGPRTRKVECPTCTVHLEVQVPSFGSQTVECGVCQHPFLVNA